MKIAALLVLGFCLTLEARVFSFKDHKFAGYLSASYANSDIKKTFFEKESSATDFSKGFKTNLGGDFGFLYQSGYMVWMFGFEVIKPPKITGGVASASGTTNYTYDSDIFVFAPKVGLEILLYQYQNLRFSINGAVGTATVDTENKYKSLTIAPNSDFTAKGEGSANLLSSGIGIEWHMADNATLVFQTQYRDLKFRKLKYSEALTSSFQGAQADGATMTKTDGTKRTLNFTGLYTTLGLRFWLF